MISSMKEMHKIVSRKDGEDSVYNSWGITHLSYTAYDSEMFWETVGIMKLGLPVPPRFDSNYARAIAIAAIQEMNKKFSEDETAYFGFQQDLLNRVVQDISKYYEEHPNAFFAIVKNKPMTKAEKIRQHSAIRGLAKERIKSKLRPVTGQMKRDMRYRKFLYDDTADQDESMTQEEKIEFGYAQHYAIKTEDMTQFDEHIISAQLDQATITSESTDIISQFFLKNQDQIKSLIPYFQNKVLLGLNPKDLWKVKVFVWKASEVYEFLEKIDVGASLDPNEKGYLYMFYLMVCIAALHQKCQSFVQAAGPVSMLIGRRHIPTLTELVIKTFLHFTKDLEKNVFSKFKFPPPVIPSDITSFGNVIKDKPRNLLKTMKLAKPCTQQPAIAALTSKLMQFKDSEGLPVEFNIQDEFESYEVFASLTQNIMDSFIEGKIKGGSDEFAQPAMLVRLTKLSSDASDKEVLEAVKGPWKASKENLEKIEYIIPVVSGKAQDICKLEKIEPDSSGRWSCSCKLADSELRAEVKGTDFSHLIPKGSQNVIKYVNIKS